MSDTFDLDLDEAAATCEAFRQHQRAFESHAQELNRLLKLLSTLALGSFANSLISAIEQASKRATSTATFCGDFGSALAKNVAAIKKADASNALAMSGLSGSAATFATAPIGDSPSVRWVGSPNFTPGRRGHDISAIVIHATAGSSLDGTIRRFANPGSKVSAHYTIGKDGTIVQHVKDQDMAWHAGKRTATHLNGRNGVNDFSIGIELVNKNDGWDSYPPAQRETLEKLVRQLSAKYDVSPDSVVGHRDVKTTKSDPKGYDLDELRSVVFPHKVPSSIPSP